MKLFAMMLAALSGPVSATADAAPDIVTPLEAKAFCSAPPGWAAVVARDPDFVVFGETHGTSEAPSLVARVVCAEALAGQRILLAVEHSASQNRAWQAAWALPHEEFRAALPDFGWRGRNDGVASEAMLALVLNAHALKDRGAAIDIVAFNGARDDEQRARFVDLPSQGPHEAAQAENIAEAAALKDYDRVIVLVGSLHAATAPISIDGPVFEPMAMRLRSYGAVLTLDMQHAGGASWSCQLAPDAKIVPGEPVTDKDIICAGHPQGADVRLDKPIFIAVGEFPNERLRAFYDGIYWVGTISASPPAYPFGE